MTEPEDDFRGDVRSVAQSEALREGADHRGHHRRDRARGGVHRRRRQGRGLDRRRRAEGSRRRSRGRGRRPHSGRRGLHRRRADAVAQAGARRRDAASARGRVSERPAGRRKVEREVKGGYEVTIARQRAFCPFSQIDLHRSEGGGARRARLPVPHRRVQGRRQEPRRLATCAARGAAARSGRRSPPHHRRRRRADRPRRLGPRLRRVRRSRRRRAGPASRLRDGVVARRGRVEGRQGRRRDHRQGAAGGRRQAEDLARPEAALRGSVVAGARRPTRSARCAAGA